MMDEKKYYVMMYDSKQATAFWTNLYNNIRQKLYENDIAVKDRTYINSNSNNVLSGNIAFDINEYVKELDLELSFLEDYKDNSDEEFIKSLKNTIDASGFADEKIKKAQGSSEQFYVDVINYLNLSRSDKANKKLSFLSKLYKTNFAFKNFRSGDLLFVYPDTLENLILIEEAKSIYLREGVNLSYSISKLTLDEYKEHNYFYHTIYYPNSDHSLGSIKTFMAGLLQVTEDEIVITDENDKILE